MVNARKNGSEIKPHVLWGEYTDIITALIIEWCHEHNLVPHVAANEMIRAHINRGSIALHARINSLADVSKMVTEARKHQGCV